MQTEGQGLFCFDAKKPGKNQQLTPDDEKPGIPFPYNALTKS